MRKPNCFAVVLSATVAVLLAGRALALPSATLSLGEPRVTAIGADIDVFVTFTPEPQSQQKAVSASLLFVEQSTVLKDDPAVFQFAPGTIVADWNLFNDPVNPGSFVLDTFDPDKAFTGGPQLLGTLKIDFSLAMTAPGEEVVLALDDRDSAIGFEDPPGDNPTFDFALLDLDPGERSFIVPGQPPQDAIPEPTTITLGMMALTAVSFATRRRRSSP